MKIQWEIKKIYFPDSRGKVGHLGEEVQATLIKSNSRGKGMSTNWGVAAGVSQRKKSLPTLSEKGGLRTNENKGRRIEGTTGKERRIGERRSYEEEASSRNERREKGQGGPRDDVRLLKRLGKKEAGGGEKTTEPGDLQSVYFEDLRKLCRNQARH